MAKVFRGFDSKFSKKKHQSKIFDYDMIKDLMVNYKVNVSNVLEICKDAYWEIGMWLAFEAARRCPVDTGTMESSIFIQEISGRSLQKFSLGLGYNPGIPYPASRYKDGRTTGSSFETVHETIAPEGWKNLGKKSQAKQNANPDIIVGGGFMRRAIDENSEEIREKIFASIKRGIAELGIQKKKHRYISKRGKLYRVGVDDDL